MLQAAFRWQHSLGDEPGHLYVPVTIGYFFWASSGPVPLPDA